MMHGFDYSGLRDGGSRAAAGCDANTSCPQPGRKKRFLDVMAALKRGLRAVRHAGRGR